MGCVNSTTKQPTQDDLARQELQLGGSWRIKCLEPKISKTVGNENMQTHDSLAEDCSVEIPRQNIFSPYSEGLSTGQIEKKRRKNEKIKHESSILSTGKIHNQFPAIKQKPVQTTCPRKEDHVGLNEDSIKDKKHKKDYGQIDQFQEFQQKIQALSKSDETETVKSQQEKQGNVEEQLKYLRKRSSDPVQMNLKSGQICAGNRPNWERSKRPGFRSPRGRSCNLFKTFEDDYIEDEETTPQIRKQESMSMGKIQN